MTARTASRGVIGGFPHQRFFSAIAGVFAFPDSEMDWDRGARPPGPACARRLLAGLPCGLSRFPGWFSSVRLPPHCSALFCPRGPGTHTKLISFVLLSV